MFKLFNTINPIHQSLQAGSLAQYELTGVLRHIKSCFVSAFVTLCESAGTLSKDLYQRAVSNDSGKGYTRLINSCWISKPTHTTAHKTAGCCLPQDLFGCKVP